MLGTFEKAVRHQEKGLEVGLGVGYDIAEFGVVFLLVGIAEMTSDAELNHIKIGFKLVVAIAVVAAAEIAAARAKRGEPKPQLVDAAGALGVLNVLVAVLW